MVAAITTIVIYVYFKNYCSDAYVFGLFIMCLCIYLTLRNIVSIALKYIVVRRIGYTKVENWSADLIALTDEIKQMHTAAHFVRCMDGDCAGKSVGDCERHLSILNEHATNDCTEGRFSLVNALLLIVDSAPIFTMIIIFVLGLDLDTGEFKTSYAICHVALGLNWFLFSIIFLAYIAYTILLVGHICARMKWSTYQHEHHSNICR